MTTASGTVAATYDAQDRSLTFGDRTYTHTAHGEVQRWTDTSGTTTLTYDVQGNLRRWFDVVECSKTLTTASFNDDLFDAAQVGPSHVERAARAPGGAALPGGSRHADALSR